MHVWFSVSRGIRHHLLVVLLVAATIFKLSNVAASNVPASNAGEKPKTDYIKAWEGL